MKNDEQNCQLIGQQNLLENVAIVAESFYTDPRIMGESFSDLFDNGSAGMRNEVVRMAETLTEWEKRNGGLESYEKLGLDWIGVVEEYVKEYVSQAIDSGDLPFSEDVLEAVLKTLQNREEDSAAPSM
ncbi:hypothetical protein [Leptospirillum ferriphilum]|uniref:hypothetical protein n=1 Tax=Leptospirillum ferriphilum TaxID=178606 RepID=UPI000AA3FD1E|nr:hypothetical protein [Leptospirillum ferriphilum]